MAKRFNKQDNGSGGALVLGGGRAPLPKRSKYGNVWTEVDGISFQSGLEANRYCELKLLQRIGEIKDLELQRRFQLEVNNIHICEYRADFCYVDIATGKTIVEDAKSEATSVIPLFQVKKRLMKACHNIDVIEV